MRFRLISFAMAACSTILPIMILAGARVGWTDWPFVSLLLLALALPLFMPLILNEALRSTALKVCNLVFQFLMSAIMAWLFASALFATHAETPLVFIFYVAPLWLVVAVAVILLMVLDRSRAAK